MHPFLAAAAAAWRLKHPKHRRVDKYSLKELPDFKRAKFKRTRLNHEICEDRHSESLAERSRGVFNLWAAAGHPGALAQFSYVTNSGAITITGCTNTEGFIDIPATIQGLPVTGIGDLVFANSQLSGVNIPNSVASIGVEAFFMCRNLAGVTIPDSVTNLGDGAFDQSGLTTVTVPGSVTSLGDSMFDGCFNLTQATLDPGVTRIGDDMFSSCPSLASVSMPGTVTNIGEYAFDSCWSLPNVFIPNGVKSIDRAAFLYCSSLASVTLPAGVMNIGAIAFSYCSELTTVWFLGIAPTMGSEVFNADDKATIYYDSDTTGWSSPFAGLTAIGTLPQINTGDGSFGLQNHQFGFDINWASGANVTVEVCTNLERPVWLPLQTITLTNGSYYFSEAWQPGGTGRYYRVRLQ